jgi:hypothetical protein
MGEYTMARRRKHHSLSSCAFFFSFEVKVFFALATAELSTHLASSNSFNMCGWRSSVAIVKMRAWFGLIGGQGTLREHNA